MKVKSEIEVAQSYLTLSDPMDCGPPGSSVHGIFQARVLEWVAIAFSVQNEYLVAICSFTRSQKLVLITEKAMAPHSSILGWKIPWTEEPGGLQSMGLRRVGHN